MNRTKYVIPASLLGVVLVMTAQSALATDTPHTTSFSWADCNQTIQAGTFYGAMDDQQSDGRYFQWAAKWGWPSSEHAGFFCSTTSWSKVDNRLIDESQSNFVNDAGTSSTNPQSTYVDYWLTQVVHPGDWVHQEQAGSYGCDAFGNNCADTITKDSASWNVPS